MSKRLVVCCFKIISCVEYNMTIILSLVNKLSKPRVIVRIAIIPFVFLIIFYYSFLSDQKIYYRTLNESLNETLIKNQILLYNEYYASKWIDLFTGEDIFKNNRCIYTTDHQDLKTSYAVLIHLRDIRKFNDLPKEKFENQKWILYNIESPMANRFWDDPNVLRKISPHFDLTMTYRLDSDIPIPYGRITKNSNDSPINVDINFKQKSKHIAWFVSNCESFSQRERIAEEMEKFIPIDVYGTCGKKNLSCPIGGHRLYNNKACYDMLSKDYKFYLSFENSVCIDYVTEKLFNILNYDVIPIVYGGANYTQILPPNSYIDVRNFTSPQHLANYLQYVGNNEKVYKSYFEWRKHFHIKFDFPDNLCDFILNDDVVGKSRTKNIFDWWFEDTCDDAFNYFWT